MDDWIGNMLSDFETKKNTKPEVSLAETLSTAEEHFNTQHYEQALDCINKALPLLTDCDLTPLHTLSAKCHCRLHHYGTALSTLQSLPTNSENSLLQAEFYLDAGWLLGATRSCDAAREQGGDPTALETRIALHKQRRKGEFSLFDLWSAYLKAVTTYCKEGKENKFEAVTIPEWEDWLHPALEIRITSDGRGRGIFVTEDVPQGTLLVAEAAYALAGSTDSLIRKTLNQIQQETDQRFTSVTDMFDGTNNDLIPTGYSLCLDNANMIDKEKEQAKANIKWETVEKIIRYNHHQLDPPVLDTLSLPVDGDKKKGNDMDKWTPCGIEKSNANNKARFPHIVGLWRFSSLTNHSVKPTVQRVYVGNVALYRTIVPLKKGDEVIDNYLELRMEHKERNVRLQTCHKFQEPHDPEVDLTDEEVKKMRATTDILTSLIGQQNFDRALDIVHDNWHWITATKDPAMVDLCVLCSEIAANLGEYEECVDALLLALDLCCNREPFSVLSCALTVRICHCALLTPQHASNTEAIQNFVDLALQHHAVVYGKPDGKRTFLDLFNPELSAKLKPYYPNSSVFRD